MRERVQHIMSEETEPTSAFGSNDGGVDCGGWYSTYDPINHDGDDSENERERERRVLEEERRFEEMYASLEPPRVSRWLTQLELVSFD